MPNNLKVPSTIPGVLNVAHPDLTIKKVRIEGDLWPTQIDVTIKNKGTADAPGSRTAILYIGTQTARLVATKETPEIPAGSEVQIHFSEVIQPVPVGNVQPGDLIIFADAPWGSGVHGNIAEQPLSPLVYMSSRELNNVFLVPFKPGHEPTEYVNPALA